MKRVFFPLYIVSASCIASSLWGGTLFDVAGDANTAWQVKNSLVGGSGILLYDSHDNKQRVTDREAPFLLSKNNHFIEKPCEIRVDREKGEVSLIGGTHEEDSSDSSPLPVQQPKSGDHEDDRTLQKEDLIAGDPLLYKSREDLYREVFKRELPPLPNNIYLAFTVDGQRRNKIQLVVSDGSKEYTFYANDLFFALYEDVRRDILEELEKRVDSRGYISKATLEESGLEVNLDLSTFHLSLNIPPQLRSTRSHYITGRARNPYEHTRVVEPHNFSAFVNISAKDSFEYERIEGEKIRQPLSINFDGAAHRGYVVLEGLGYYSESDYRVFRRKDVRLLYDNPRDAIRYTVGDLRFPIVGYQSVASVGGISVSKDFSLQPYSNAYPVKEFEFFLESASTVEVFVNDALATTLFLDPGVHNITDFPFSSGSNDVTIKITDDSGREQTMQFTFIYEPVLLAKGQAQYSYNAGVNSKVVEKEYVYDVREPFFSLFYRRGMSERLTAGYYFQGTKTQLLCGFEGVRAFTLGKVQFDAAVSDSKRSCADMALKASYSYIPKGEARKKNIEWKSEVEYLGYHFARISDASPHNISALGVKSSSSFSLMHGVNARVAIRYGIRRGKDNRNTWSISTMLLKSFFSQVRAHVSAECGRDMNDVRYTNVQATAYWSYSGLKRQYSISKVTGGDLEVTAGLLRKPSSPWKDANLSARFGSGATGEDVYKGHVGYEGDRGIIQVEQKYRRLDYKVVKNTTSITAQASLVYVDRNIALARPVNNGFVLLKGVKNLRDIPVIINPGKDRRSSGRSGKFGGAVITNISGYRYTNIHLEPSTIPQGYIPEMTSSTLFPRYKSGYAFYIGGETMIIASGRLVDDAGEPLAFKTVRGIPENGSESDQITFFTNKRGRFQILGIFPGRYRFSCQKSENTTYSIVIEIPTTEEAVIRIGDIVAR